MAISINNGKSWAGDPWSRLIVFWSCTNIKISVEKVGYIGTDIPYTQPK